MLVTRRGFVRSASVADARSLDWQHPQRPHGVAPGVARCRVGRVLSAGQSTAAQTVQRGGGASSNARQGTFLVYVNSFNEWHEGTQFEPMKDYADLTAEERRVGYHNPADGGYRLRSLRERLAPLLQG